MVAILVMQGGIVVTRIYVTFIRRTICDGKLRDQDAIVCTKSSDQGMFHRDYEAAYESCKQSFVFRYLP